MEPLSRDTIKQIFTDAIAPLVVEMKAANESHDKDIKRLFTQSEDHDLKLRALEDRLINQVSICQNTNLTAQEKTGVRVGTSEIELAKMEQRMDTIENDILEMKDTKKFNITSWIAAAGFIIFLIVEAVPLLKG